MSWLSRANVYERRRIVLVFVVTIVVIPLAWWSQHSPKTEHPKVSTDLGTESQNLTPGFLTGSKQTVPISTVPISAASAEDALVRTGMATYKNFAVRPVKVPGSTTTSTIVPTTVLPKDVCILNFLPEGTKVTIENSDNGRSVACHVRWQTIPSGMIVVLNAPLFQKISELTQAPIPVRISW